MEQHVVSRLQTICIFVQADRVTPMNKPFNKVANYSTALMTFKAIQKICPPYLSKRFILCGNGGDPNAQGVQKIIR